MKNNFFKMTLLLCATVALVFSCSSAMSDNGGDGSSGSYVDPSTQSGYTIKIAGAAYSTGSSDGIGSSAKFNNPSGIISDGTNLYVSDTANHTIRKIVISSGAVTTFAGTAGSYGSNDETGSSAKFNYPRGMTTDGTNIYLADSQNHTIRKIVISSAEVTTLAGSAGNSGSTDGAGNTAKFCFPDGIATDGTNLYITDNWNNTIRKIVISSGVVTTIAGTAGTTGSADGTGISARFNSPTGIAISDGNLYVADSSNYTIRKIVISSGVVTTIAGAAGTSGSADGTGLSARFNNPSGITTDGSYLYVADTSNFTIRKIVISTGVVITIAGKAGSYGSTDGSGTNARFSNPKGIVISGLKLYLADSGTTTIRAIVK